jgi:Uma2 family endonuclease
MSADAVGRAMPATITLDDLAEMNSADPHGHRYETSPDGVLFVVPPPDTGHAVIASRLMAWFLSAGWPPELVVQVAGVRIPGPDGDGGRIPDLVIWSGPQPPEVVWSSVRDVRLVVEIISRGSATVDQGAKVTEYAAAGIPHYWTVARDAAQTVTLYRLGATGAYDVAAKMPLAWLLRTAPAEQGMDGPLDGSHPPE